MIVNKTITTTNTFISILKGTVLYMILRLLLHYVIAVMELTQHLLLFLHITYVTFNHSTFTLDQVVMVSSTLLSKYHTLDK